MTVSTACDIEVSTACDIDCEHSPIPEYDGCIGAANANFPNNANMPVRTRYFGDSPESCSTTYEPMAASRDTQVMYDWRGRPVIVAR